MVMRDGIKLHPQPTSDPLDPLNWARWRKNCILAIVMALYFMFTYITTTTVPSFPQIQEQYGIDLGQVNWTVAIPALGLSVGPLFWSSLADIYGRRIIFIIGTVIAFAATIGAAKAQDYQGYMAARFFQGFGVSPAATVGLAIINDIYFEYQRGLKVGLWVLAIDMGLIVGPLIGGFMDLVDQYWVNWLTAIFFAVILAAEIAFLPETLYPRNHMLRVMPYTENSGVADIEKSERRASIATDESLPRTKTLTFINVKPVPGMKHPKPWDSILRFALTFKYLTVFAAVWIFCFGWYWWVLSVITFIPSAYIQYSPQIQGLLFIGLILGTLFSELFFSGRLSDWLTLKLAKRNNGIRLPEMRLWLAYPAALLSAIGLILWGISIDKAYHWIVGQIAFFLFAAGIQMGNTAIASYIVDCYPLQSMSVITFYSVILNLSAFVNPFFIAPWVTAQGYTWTFAVQGIITFWFCVPALACVHYFGPKMRQWSGMPGWVNPEYDTIA
ncbi:MFS transporter [Lophium mytilinum]|uniref:MFS transporter n=1 Tax=Lophium mytilinum TaxID=390894 RepID=A0A6A6R263_9PEZI|nr:MFS transporter [Lophium mytilinum]